MELSLLLGLLIGLVLGLTGAGGGILAVPALVAGMGWSMQQAAPVALIAVALSAAVGALSGMRLAIVRYRAATLIALSGLPFTALGASLAQGLPHAWLMLLFSGVMLLVAARQLLLGKPAAPERHYPCAGCLNPASGRFDWSLATAGLMAGIGSLAGFMTGLLGVGGGFILVPLLQRFTNLSQQSIVATSLMVIALVGAGGVGMALLHGVHPPWTVTLEFTAATALGMLGGRQLARRIPACLLQRLFALVVAVVACGLLVQALRSL